VSVDARLRAVGVHDAAELSAVHAGCFADSWSPQSMTEVLRTPGTFGFLAEIDAAPPMALALARVAADEAELLTIGVAGGWRRAGIARRLLASVIAEARARGARRLFLEVAENNHAARGLYERESFRVVGRRDGYYARIGGAPIDALTMRRELTRPWTAWFRR
jgi:ribosomal-protein-alanine N-acetyltransferase